MRRLHPIAQVIAQVCRFLRAREGATAIEYALIAAGVSIAIIVGVSAVGAGIMNTFYNKIGTLF